jgi:hypothetical protein
MFIIGPMPMDKCKFWRVLQMVGKQIEENQRLKRKDQRDGETKSHFFCQKEIQNEKEKPKNIDK